MSLLENKTLIVTGASSGIGRALALELAAQGVHLALNARRAEHLESVAAECRERGAQAVVVVGNAAEAAVADELARQAFESGSCVGFIHAAGVLSPGPYVWELEEERFKAVFDASVTAAWQLIRTVVPRLRARGQGLAVFFGSGAAQITQAGIGAYCAAKAAEEHLMRQLANEAPELDVFAYRPGIVETQMQEQARGATGGAAQPLSSLFWRWKEQGELLTPEESARGLVRCLQEPERHRGKVVHV